MAILKYLILGLLSNLVVQTENIQRILVQSNTEHLSYFLELITIPKKLISGHLDV